MGSFGGSFMSLGGMTLEGPGTILGRGVDVGHGDRFCAPRLPDFHGSTEFFSPGIEVEIPANTTSAIALPGRRGSDAPWPGMDLGVEFRVSHTSQNEQIVRSPSPDNSGRYGVRISLRTDPGSGPPCSGFTPVGLGKEVLVTGQADTTVAGDLMTIRYVREGEAGARDLANVRVGEDGTFLYRWLPSQPGKYALGALYRSQSPKLADDFSTPSGLLIVKPPKPANPNPPPNPNPPLSKTTPAGITAARRVRCHRRRCAIAVAGSIKRPRAATTRTGVSEAAAGCTGNIGLRVAAGGSRLLSSRVRVRRSCRYLRPEGSGSTLFARDTSPFAFPISVMPCSYPDAAEPCE